MFVGASHMLSLSVLAGHAVAIVVWWWTSRDLTIVRRWIVAVSVGMVPMLPMIVIGLQERAQITPPLPSWSVAVDSVSLTFGGRLLGWTMVGASATARWRDHRSLAMIAGWALVAPAALFAVSYVQPLYTWRYVLFSVPAWCLLVAVAIATDASLLSRRGWWAFGRSVLALLLLIGISIDTNHAYRARTERQDADYGAALSIITQSERSGDAVAFGTADWIYLLPVAVDYFVPANKRPRQVFTERSAQASGWWMPTECSDLASCLGDTQRIWLARATGWRDDPLKGIDGMNSPKEALLRAHFTIVAQRWSGVVGVVLLQRKPGR